MRARHMALMGLFLVFATVTLPAQNGTLVVRVVDMGENGKPIPGATVWIGATADPKDPPTDANGIWRKPGLTVGKRVTVTYRKPTYRNDPEQSEPLLPDGGVHDVALFRPDREFRYYIEISAMIRVLVAKATGVETKKEVYAREWTRLSSLPDDNLKIVGAELMKTASPADLELIPKTARNMRLLVGEK